MIQTDIALLRLANQKITASAFTEPSQVLSCLGAIQGQDYLGAKWSIGIRMPGSTDNDVEAALASRKILRTWLFRGTLHLVAASDIDWMRKLVAAKIITGNERRYKELGLDAPALLKSNSLLVKFLQRDQPLSRTDLLASLEKYGISTEGQRAAYMLQRASLDGLICQTNTVRNIPNYVLLDHSFAPARGMTREDAVAELVGRYFTSRGPATLQDCVWWSGLTVTEVKAGLEANKPVLQQESFEGHEYWFPSSSQPPVTGTDKIYFLPGFDEFLLGYKDRGVSLDPALSDRWCPGNNGMFFPFIVHDGRVAGIWKREFKKTSVSLEIMPFPNAKHLTGHPDFALAAREFAQFAGLELVM